MISSFGPIAADGKPFFLPNIFPGDVLLNFAGRGDLNGQRYGGPLFGLSKEGQGVLAADFRFQDGVFLAGGNVGWTGGSFGSYVKMELYAPSSTTIPADPAGTGNANLVPTGLGFDIIVPAAGDGARTLTVPVPVPAADDETNAQTGYWDYTEPWVGTGEVTPGTPQQAKFNLFNNQLPLAHFTTIPLVTSEGDKTLIVENIKPKWVLPEWFFRVSIYNAEAANTLKVGWSLVIARRKSV